MTSIEELISVFNKCFPKLTVTKIVDYSPSYILFEATENVGEIDFNDPYYIVNKKTGDAAPFMPMMDFDRFMDAMENRVVYERE